jgi:hypothetical protein
MEKSTGTEFVSELTGGNNVQAQTWEKITCNQWINNQ